MAANTYITIDDIVNNVALTIGDDSYLTGSLNYQLRLLALQGLKELSFDMLQEVKSVELAVSSTGTITLPDDYIKYVKIGILGSDGKVHYLGKQDNLNLVSGAASTDSNDIDDDPAYFYGIGGRYGVGGGTNHNGYYRVNKEDNTISFSSDAIGKNIILEYISNGVTLSNVQPVKRKISFTIAAGSAITDGNFFRIYKGDGSVHDIKILLTDDTDIENIHPTAPGLMPVVIVPFATSNGSSTVCNRIKGAINSQTSNITATSEGSVLTLEYDNYIEPTKFTGNSQSGPFAGVLPLTEGELNVNTGDSIYNALYGYSTSGSSNNIVSNFTLINAAVAETTGADAINKVHQFAEEALTSYVYWKYIQRKRGVPFGEKQLAKRDYFNEKRLANARMKSFTKDEAMQTSRKAFKQSPKI